MTAWHLCLRVGGFQNPGVCLQAFPSFLPLHSSPYNSLLPNCTETLATQVMSTQSIQTLYFGWHLKSYHFAIFLLQILLFVVKTLKYLVDLSFEHLSFSKTFPVLSRFCNRPFFSQPPSPSSCTLHRMSHEGHWALSVLSCRKPNQFRGFQPKWRLTCIAPVVLQTTLVVMKCCNGSTIVYN